MTPEQIGNAVLYHGDCLEILPTLPKIDAVITDPPYGVGLKYGSHDDSPAFYESWRNSWFAQIREMAPLVAISCGVGNVTGWPKPSWIMCWHKPASMGRCYVGFNNWEPVLLYGKPKTQVVDVFRAPIVPDSALGGHPCPKPLEWGMQLVGKMTEERSLVLDPFMGSGTTGVACMNLGRKFIGIEIEKKYFDIACERIDQAQRQKRMFA